MQIKNRSIAVCIILSIITCGIYALYWIAVLNDDANAATNQQNATTGGMVVLFTIITCGIYGLYWQYKQGEKLDNLRAANGIPTGSLSILYLVLSIFGFSIISDALMQSEINKYSNC